MEVKEVYVAKENLGDIFKIMEETLASNPNTQVFIDKEIYRELNRNGSNYNVSHHNYAKGFHYYHDREDYCGGEEWLELSDGHLYGSKGIARGSFIGNTEEYMQLVEFSSSKIENYTHFLSGFEQLLLILLKTE